MGKGEGPEKLHRNAVVSPGGSITKLGVKKTLWFHLDEAEALRNLAFKERRSEASIVREAVRKFMDLED